MDDDGPRGDSWDVPASEVRPLPTTRIEQGQPAEHAPQAAEQSRPETTPVDGRHPVGEGHGNQPDDERRRRRRRRRGRGRGGDGGGGQQQGGHTMGQGGHQSGHAPVSQGQSGGQGHAPPPPQPTPAPRPVAPVPAGEPKPKRFLYSTHRKLAPGEAKPRPRE